MVSRKMVLMNLISGQQWRIMENRPIDKVGGEEGEGEMYGESNIEIYNTMCKTDGQWNLLYDSGNSNRGSGTGRGVRWEGR